MSDNPEPTASISLVVFQSDRRLGGGDYAQTARIAHRATMSNPDLPVLVFDRRTGRVVDLDLRGDEQEAAARYETSGESRPEPVRRGRPRLGVTAREVTLLPRHWDWLADQPGGASAALRRLVDAARKADEGQSDARMRREAAYGFMSVMAGDREGFEDAARALFAGDLSRLNDLMIAWPSDVAEEIRTILTDDRD